MYPLAYYITTSLLFLALTLVWKKDDLLNLTIKIILAVMLIWSGLNLAMHTGLVLAG